MKKTRLVLAGGLVILLFAGLVALRLDNALRSNPYYGEASPIPVELPASNLKGRLRPDFRLTDLNGIPHQVTEWDGKVLVVNFWATWCPPCRQEIPEFIKLQEQYGDQGLQLVGIAIDQPDSVREFVKTMGVNYPILIGSSDAATLSRNYGNAIGALPYTAIVNRSGRIAFTKYGELSREEAEAVIRELL